MEIRKRGVLVRMKTDYKKLLKHYVQNYNEQSRFTTDRAHSIEYITTMHFLLSYLPKGCTVLDCCAAGGAYAFPLAENGYKVTAGDLVQEHVDILNAKNENGLFESVYCGNVLDMSRFMDNQFDAVLCMGALYHLMNYEERLQCVSECLRVLKTGGVFMFAYINRNASYIHQFNQNILSLESQSEIWKNGKNELAEMFYLMDFNEPQKLADNFPLEKITDIGINGLIYPLLNRINGATQEEFNAYMEYHLATCEQPSIIGHSMHGLWIGKKI